MKDLKMCLFFIGYLLITPMAFGQDDETELFEQGVELSHDGHYKKAILKLKAAIEINAENDGARYELAYAYLQMGDEKNALKNCKLLLKKDTDLWLDASLVYGAAQEQMGEKKKAIKTYKKAALKYPENYLVKYNLALSYYNLEDYNSAEFYASEAIKLNRSHASSHFLMSYIMLEQNELVKAMLAMYYFLLVEQDTDRANKVQSMLELLWKSGVSKNGSNTFISIGKSDNDFFRTVELAIKLKAASYNDKDEAIDKLAIFAENTTVLFDIISESYDGDFGFWELTYIDYFMLLHQKGHTMSFANFICNGNYQPQVLVWMSDHYKQFYAFMNWMELNQL